MKRECLHCNTHDTASGNNGSATGGVDGSGAITEFRIDDAKGETQSAFATRSQGVGSSLLCFAINYTGVVNFLQLDKMTKTKNTPNSSPFRSVTIISSLSQGRENEEGIVTYSCDIALPETDVGGVWVIEIMPEIGDVTGAHVVACTLLVFVIPKMLGNHVDNKWPARNGLQPAVDGDVNETVVGHEMDHHVHHFHREDTGNLPDHDPSTQGDQWEGTMSLDPTHVVNRSGIIDKATMSVPLYWSLWSQAIHMLEVGEVSLGAIT